jgi:large subunit ribosomal protein L6
MSRIGRMPLQVPKGTKVEISDAAVTIEGPKGKVRQPLLDGIEVVVDGQTVQVSRKGDAGPERSRHGLLRALLANAVRGVSEGFQKELQVVGVGYRGEVKGSELHLSLGYSHPVVFPVPAGIEVEIDKQNKITVRGADRQQVGQVAAEIRGLRPPDAYKGKGIRYMGEVLRLKEGKSGAGGKS